MIEIGRQARFTKNLINLEIPDSNKVLSKKLAKLDALIAQYVEKSAGKVLLKFTIILQIFQNFGNSKITTLIFTFVFVIITPA